MPNGDVYIQGSVTFKVQVPAMPDKPEWKLLGQQLTITLPITDPVSYHC